MRTASFIVGVLKLLVKTVVGWPEKEDCGPVGVGDQVRRGVWTGTEQGFIEDKPGQTLSACHEPALSAPRGSPPLG